MCEALDDDSRVVYADMLSKEKIFIAFLDNIFVPLHPRTESIQLYGYRLEENGSILKVEWTNEGWVPTPY